MKKSALIILALFGILIVIAQPPCLPTAGGIPAGDELPGCSICGPIYFGSTADYTGDSLNFDFPCGTIENNQWLTFIPDLTGNINPKILMVENCSQGSGIEMAIYDFNLNLNLVSDCRKSTDSILNLATTGLIPGDTYFIMIDGINGAECEFTLATSVPNPGIPDPGGPMTATPNNSPLCPGAEVCYSISPVPDFYYYEWLIPGNGEITSGGGPRDTFACVEYISPGGGVVRVTPSSFCFPGIPIITPVVVVPILPNLGVSLSFCPDEFPIFLGTNQVDSAGTYTFTFTTSLGCDSTVLYNIFEEQIVPEVIDTLICGGTCVQLGDSCYYESTDELIDLFCREISELNISTIDSFPAPQIECQVDLPNVFYSWDDVIGAENYVLSINGGMNFIWAQNNILLTNISIDSAVTIEVQPQSSSSCIFKSATLTCPEISATLNSTKESNLKIFPNPTTGLIRIQSDSAIEKLTVFTPSGKQILSNSTTEIDLSGFGPGVFYLKIFTEKGIVLRKAVLL